MHGCATVNLLLKLIHIFRISAASVARTAYVCQKQAAMGQSYYISKKKNKEKILSQNRWKRTIENRTVAVVVYTFDGVYKLVYISLYILTERI